MVFGHFFQDRRGGVAPMLALAILPVVGLMGAAVDYSRANLARTSMQAAADSTALMLSKEASTLSPEALGDKANEYFKALFVNPEVENVHLTSTLTTPQAGSFSLKLEGTATIKTVFVGMLGQSQINLFTSSEVLWGIKKLNLALALDNTGSMSSSGKMTALKEAAHNLLTSLKTAEKTPGDIKVSVVPFATDVNVGTGNVSSSWIDWTEWDTAHGSCSKNKYDTQADCLANDKIWTADNHNTWNGCVYDRDQNNDVLNTATGSASSTKYRAHQASNCPTTMMPLSTDWTALNSKIDAMTPNGNTNVTIGMQVAWQTLSPVAPFNAPAPAADLDKVIILLTDGDNTQNRWSSTASVIDARTQKACDNAKADNVKVYTVRVIQGNQTLLKNCATSPDMYYEVDQASQLNGVFSSISQKLATLRLAK
ncbi:MAG: VWA domain-containing protein [Pseudomonadota bacterium]|nr:VWA domain-containing protein [Pseudomonadota bacterium]